MLRNRKWVAILAALMFLLAALPAAASPLDAPAQQAATVTGTCNGISIMGAPAAVAAALAALGCTTQPAVAPVAVRAGSNTCRVNVASAYLRSGPGTSFTPIGSARDGQVLNVVDAQANWLLTTSGWISAPLCTMVPPSVWVAPSGTCEQTSRILPNGDKIDVIKGERGEDIQVTILSSGPLCDPYRVIWDGVRIRQDKLPEEGKRQPFERDWTGWWDGAATWAGVSCLLEQDMDMNPDTPRLAVFDREGRVVGTTHGTQVFDLQAGGWYMSVCSGTFNPGFTVIKPVDAWTLQP